MPDIDDHAEMTALLLEEKDAQKRLDQARALYDLWRPRYDLARKANNDSLAEAAAQRLDEAKQIATTAKLDLAHLKDRKEVLRSGIRHREIPDDTANAEGLLEQFRAMGVDPDAETINQAAKQQTAEDQLAALKRRL